MFETEKDRSPLEKRLMGYRLATAEILYRMPDHPDFLQTFVWQDLDLAPRFPVLKRFLDFWHSNLDGRLYSVRVASSALLAPTEFHFGDGEFRLH
ncbi:MAG: usg protein [Rhodothalassiaceae bacterium]